MRPLGLFIIIIAILGPLGWFLPLMGVATPIAVFSQYIGVASLIAMSLVQLIATRARWVEPIFGSLDRVYVLHKWLAIASLGLAGLHSVIDAEVGRLVPIAILGDAAEGLGSVALYGLIGLSIASIIKFIPYHLWKWSHKLMGGFFALAAMHYFFIPKPFEVTSALGLYVGAFCLAGMLAYLYMLMPCRLRFNTKKYEVTAVIPHTTDIAEIKLRPLGRGLKHKAGQFAFVNFQAKGLTEIHPYTISSAPNEERELSFMIKTLGDYTTNLARTLQPGTQARISKAFGHFRLANTKGTQVWIAAGIGVTPFIAWAETLTEEWSTPIRLYYCVRSRKQAVHLDKLEAIAHKVKNFKVILVVSNEHNRLTAERIAHELGTQLKSAHAYFCGPTTMREALRVGLMARGLRRSRFHYEEFEMRQGIGLTRLVKKVVTIMQIRQTRTSGMQKA